MFPKPADDLASSRNGFPSARERAPARQFHADERCSREIYASGLKVIFCPSRPDGASADARRVRAAAQEEGAMQRCFVSQLRTVAIVGGTLAATVLLARTVVGQDPCAGVNGAAAGVCRAYCRALQCPEGHPGAACETLRVVWSKHTGSPLFPCDRVCCACPNGSEGCSTAARCAAAACQIVDRCIDGRCPERVCCQCPFGCDEATENRCREAGCEPQPGALCHDTGRCAEACPCGDPCTNPAGLVGVCRPLDPTQSTCECFIPPPVDCPCGATCIDGDGNAGECVPVAGEPNRCFCRPL